MSQKDWRTYGDAPEADDCKHCGKPIEPFTPAHGAAQMHWACYEQHQAEYIENNARVALIRCKGRHVRRGASVWLAGPYTPAELRAVADLIDMGKL